VSAFDLHAKPRVGEGLCHHSLDFQSFFFLIRHTQPVRLPTALVFLPVSPPRSVRPETL
jgi:hypothetical protein